MFAVDPNGDSRGPRRERRFQRREVARMDDSRSQSAKEPEKCGVERDGVARSLAQRNVLNIASCNALAKLCVDFGQRYDCVAP